MKHHILLLVVLSFFPFVMYSPAGSEKISQNEATAYRLMTLLSVGNIGGYQRIKQDIDPTDMEEIFTFVTQSGDSILHFIVNLERFADLRERYNLEQVLIKEVQFIFNILGPDQFIRLLRKKNNEGLSPLQEAISSTDTSLKSEGSKFFLLPYSSQNMIVKTLEERIPNQNRGLVYKVFQVVIGSYNWSNAMECGYSFGKKSEIQETKKELGL